MMGGGLLNELVKLQRCKERARRAERNRRIESIEIGKTSVRLFARGADGKERVTTIDNLTELETRVWRQTIEDF